MNLNIVYLGTGFFQKNKNKTVFCKELHSFFPVNEKELAVHLWKWKQLYRIHPLSLQKQ